MFESLSDRLTSVFRSLGGHAVLTDENIRDGLREVRLALLEADVNFTVVKQFTDKIQERCLGQDIGKNLSPSQQLVKIVNDELIELLGGEDSKLSLDGQPTVIMLCGLQGSGKTTSAAKLATFLRKKKHRPYLVPADVYRPAAITQLTTLARQLDIPCYPSTIMMKPARLAAKAVEAAREEGADVVILDTAGRLHIDNDLMEELSSIKETVHPQEILFVADAMTGQDAVTVATKFHDQLSLTGVVLTKMDGDARGGAALSIKSVTGVGVKFVGTGEKVSELEEFHPDRIAGRILGMGDVLTLIEKTQTAMEAEEAERLSKKIQKATFDFEDFLTQMHRVKKMGSLTSIMKLIPGLGGLVDKLNAAGGMPEKELAKTEAIINSMTLKERHNPDIIDSKRRARIAAGSGTSVAAVNQLQRQFQQMRKMMQSMMQFSGKKQPQMPSSFPGGMPGLGGLSGGFNNSLGGLGGLGGMGGFPGMPGAGMPGIPGTGHSSTKKKRDVAKERSKNKNRKKH